MKVLAMFFALTTMTAESIAQFADVVFVNGKVWTMDRSKPRAEAVAVSEGRILAVGANAEVKKFKTASTRIVDLKGKLMLPGFIDNHVHFVSGGFQLQNVDLRYAKDEKEFAALIGERAKEFPERWITGGDWDHDRWPGGNLPTKAMIDPVAPNTPVFVSRYDGHMGVANSRALAIAGITKDTPDPQGGTIVRDPKTGEPTGLLKDEAMGFIWAKVPDNTDEEILDAARAALNEAKKYGVTSVQDITYNSHMRAYQKLQKSGELTLRIFTRLPIGSLEHMSSLGINVPFGDDWIKIGSLKAFADGSLGSSTALFFDPYLSDPSTKGLGMDILIDGRLEKWALEADKANLQLSIHAIGDSANSRVLDIFERIAKENPSWDRRFRIEHAQHIHPKDFKRFAELGVIASVQPYHAIDDARWAEQRIGKERCKTTYPFKTFMQNGVKLCFGSDWTVAPLNPLLGIYAAATRRSLDGKNPDGWIPEQKISVSEAIECYTINNAYAEFSEGSKGSIEIGKLADFVVLNRNILEIDPVEIEHVKVDMTIVGGATVYERK